MNHQVDDRGFGGSFEMRHDAGDAFEVESAGTNLYGPTGNDQAMQEVGSRNRSIRLRVTWNMPGRLGPLCAPAFHRYTRVRPPISAMATNHPSALLYPPFIIPTRGLH